MRVNLLWEDVDISRLDTNMTMIDALCQFHVANMKPPGGQADNTDKSIFDILDADDDRASMEPLEPGLSLLWLFPKAIVAYWGHKCVLVFGRAYRTSKLLFERVVTDLANEFDKVRMLLV
jgi:hypothetical protein